MKFAAHLGIAAAAAIVCFGFVSAPQIAHAQKSNCILDNCADQKPAAAVPAKPDTMTTMAHRHVSNAPGDFDFYVLALSWSPGFCQTHNARRAGAQCESGSNLDFVVHGLWPQDTHGFPSRCEPAARYPSRFALEGAKGLYPDIGLARHEWSMHGTCSGKSPTDYFAEVRRARAAVVIPPQFRNAHATQTWTPVDIQRAFIAANPRLRPGMLAVACNRSVLSEVRICLSKDLRNFVACPEVARHFCYAHQITVPPVR